MSAHDLTERFFRDEHARLVASLVRRVGTANLGLAQDAAQSALATALDVWPRTATPDNPSAWLFRVAHRALLGELRKDHRRRGLLEASPPAPSEPEMPDPRLAEEVSDDLLRLLFVCCDDRLPRDSRLVLALSVLCGLSVSEIAARLFTSHGNVHKRLSRARAQLREAPPDTDALDPEHLVSRRPAVHRVLYVMFTEGYLSVHADAAIRADLCDEALRLGTLLADHPVAGSPESAALVALMHLHRARLPAREDPFGGLVLLEDQDRSRWDRAQIALGLRWLARSADGDAFSRYHAEAGIAAEHALAPSFADTAWHRVVDGYLLLEQVAPSPLHTLNRAVALAEAEGPPAALALLEQTAPPSWLAGSYVWAAVLADLERRCGHLDAARRYREQALATAPSDAIRDLLVRRLDR